MMSIDVTTTDESSNELHETIGRLVRGVRDAEAGRMAREEMDRMREEIRQKHGLLDIAVPSIRDLRDN